MSIGTGHAAPASAPAPGQPHLPGRRWAVALAGIIGAYLLLAVYGVVVNAGAIGADSAPLTAASASRQVKAGSSASVTPSGSASGTATRPAARALEVTSATAFGPAGPSDGDNPGIASRVLDVRTNQPWYSQWYATPEFGGLRSGTGLMLDLAKAETVTDVQLALGSRPGASVQVRVGNAPSLDLPTVATATGVSGTVRLTATTRAAGRYVLIWFTRLPPDGSGRYQASVYSATVDGLAGK